MQKLKEMASERVALYIALVVAWVAMVGSLYFSEVLLYEPCEWCWRQRILMYPLTGILALGLIRRDRNLPYYTMLFSGVGIVAATIHYLIQKTSWFNWLSVSCDPNNPCSTLHINLFGFITIPFLALIAFAIIFFCAFYASGDNGATTDEPITKSSYGAVFGILAGVLLVLTPFIINPPVAPDSGRGLIEALGDSSSPITLYQASCARCHGVNGEGIVGQGPVLADAPFTESATVAEWIALVRAGRGAMPPSGGNPDLTDEQLAQMLEFLRDQ